MRERHNPYKAASLILALALVAETAFISGAGATAFGGLSASAHAARPIPPGNGTAALNARWGSTLKELVEAGALNISFLSERIALTPSELAALNGSGSERITLNSTSAMFNLYSLWALGINNRNPILTNGSISNFGGDPYGLASTGGYGPLGNLSLGELPLITLTRDEQAMAESVASNVYRPCCNNPAAFPDCNHGAAQLGLIELMASQGNNATAIYGALKEFDEIYYPEQYAELSVYLNATRGMPASQAPGELMLGSNYSSYSGAARVHSYLAGKGLLPTSGPAGTSC